MNRFLKIYLLFYFYLTCSLFSYSSNLNDDSVQASILKISCLDTACLNNEINNLFADKLSATEATKKISDLIQSAKNIKFNKGLASLYLYQGISYYRLGNLNEAIHSYQESLKFRSSKNEWKEVSRTYNNLALAYADLSEYSSALKFHNKALNIRKINKDTGGVAASLMNIGLLFERQGKYDESQKNYLNSLLIREHLRDSDGISSCLNNIGTSFFYMGKMDKAMEYYQRSFLLSKRNRNSLHIGKSLGNIAMIFDQQQQFDSALIYYRYALKFFKELNSNFQIATLYNNLALVYTNLQKTDSAIYYHIESKNIKSKIGDVAGLATTLINLGNLYFKDSKFEEAFLNYKEGLKLSLQLKQWPLIMNAYNGISEYYRVKKDYKNCFENFQLANLYKDSIYNINKTRIIHELEGRYNTEKAEAQLMEKDLQLTRQKLNSSLQRNRFLTTLIALIVFLFVGIILLFSYRKIKLLNQSLKNKISENEMLMREINHRVKNNLQLVSGLLKLPQKEINSDNAKLIMQETRNRVQAIGIIHKSLYKDENSTTRVNMKEYIRELSQNIIQTLSDKNIECSAEIDEFYLDVDSAVPLALITNELITNSIKHAFKNVNDPKIAIQIKQQLNEINLLIEDNGIANISFEEQNNNESFGTRLIKTLSEQLNAKYSLTFNNGMQFRCTFQIQAE